MTIDKLTTEEAAEVLKQGTLGRLGCIAEGEPYVVPVHYFYDGENIYIHSLPGKKITALRANGRACLQVDDIRDSYHWRSVIAYGNYEEISDERLHELALAELFRRVPHLTPVESKMTKGNTGTIVFRLRVNQMTGVGETW
jgi:nitroimidazol reductase NimA-like FMN-containing flavoprotein (pyridoxamine 5'-phosphate oxidase superfamily)